MKMTNIIQRISGKDPRSALLLKNVLASLAVKGWSVVVQLLLVPLTLACLGVYENGVWLTISSVLLWIDNLDVGLGNGLRNKLAVCLAENNIEKARQMVSSTIAMLTCIIVPVTIVLLIAECVGDVYAFLNVSPQRIGNLVTICWHQLSWCVPLLYLSFSETFTWVYNCPPSIMLSLQVATHWH